MINWKPEKPVFDSGPRWAMDAVTGFRGHIWAPDISYYKGQYYLFYSVSAFGKNTSCIGLTTNTTLNTADPAYHWTDHGKIIQSFPGKDHWNAIDPNMALDDKGEPWLAFGSFWGGLQLVKLNKDMLGVDEQVKQQVIASRIKDTLVKKMENPIEGAFIFKKDKYYYLFASIDYCCKGPLSTYKMIVGRSKKISGPYLDEEGNSMEHGGGTLLLQGDSSWYGVGHNAVCRFDNTDYLIFHGYDAKDNGRSKLLVEKITWEKGWPLVAIKKD
jgi:arabinan endo-1,5-alpha-L-arabinosidase